MAHRKDHPHRPLLCVGLPVFILIVLFLPGYAWACDCMAPGMPDDELKNYDLVFMGQVIENDEDAGFARLAVKKTWKGDLLKMVELPSNYTGCGFYFESGQRYLVYARRDEDGFTTSSCTPTKQVNWAHGDMMFLDATVKGESRPAILKRLLPLIRTHKNNKVREGVVRLLRVVPNDQDPPKMLKFLLTAMRDPSGNVRVAATFTLYVKSYYKKSYYYENKKFIEAMIKGLQDEELSVRFYSANALNAAAPYFRNKNPGLRKRVTKALSQALKMENVKVLKHPGGKAEQRKYSKKNIEMFEKAIGKWKVQ